MATTSVVLNTSIYAVQCSCKEMLTGRFLLAKCPDRWPQPGDVKGDGGKINVEFKTRAGGHPDFELTNQ